MIGVFDSGVGGLSILKALLGEMPGERFIYLSDAGHAPYGEKSGDEVLARSRAVTAYLRRQGIRALVVACNTATAAAIDPLRAENPDLPIIGVEPGLKPALALSTTGRIGVMATRGTLESPRFKRLMQSFGEPAQTAFVLQACDGLAMAIEQSTHQAEADPAAQALVQALCAKHLAALGEFGLGAGHIDTLVLGCTHYPFAASVLRQLTGPAVQFVDPGEAVARQTRLRLEIRKAGAWTGATEWSGFNSRSGPSSLSGSDASSGSEAIGANMSDGQRVRLETTGDPRDLQAAAQRWLGLQATALKTQCK